MAILPPLVDSQGRRIEYLRIALTERCDLRCVYCRPPAAAQTEGQDVLSLDDVLVLGEAAAGLGIRHLRLTGGEPLLRDDLPEIIRGLRRQPEIEDLALTTNGQRLASCAEALVAAGLDRVNISLDSLDPATYAAITGGDVSPALAGLEAALAAGLAPVKGNVVLTQAAVREAADLAPFVSLIRRLPVHVRFIEAMPTCQHVPYVPAARVLDWLAAMGDLQPTAGPAGSGPARYYQLDGARGTFGCITPITEPFCAQCNRLRVTARGDLLPCLFSPSGPSLLPALRGPDPVGEAAAALALAAAAKPACAREVAPPAGIAAMHAIGG
jgi:cyclic pyranopterin phosphate synthase